VSERLRAARPPSQATLSTLEVPAPTR
jgi:hypothetical protein